MWDNWYQPCLKIKPFCRLSWTKVLNMLLASSTPRFWVTWREMPGWAPGPSTEEMPLWSTQPSRTTTLTWSRTWATWQMDTATAALQQRRWQRRRVQQQLRRPQESTVTATGSGPRHFLTLKGRLQQQPESQQIRPGLSRLKQFKIIIQTDRQQQHFNKYSDNARGGSNNYNNRKSPQ